MSKATDFITRWDLSLGSTWGAPLTFGVVTTGPVNYTWETIPAITYGANSTSSIQLLSSISLFPNPASSSATLEINAKYQANATLSVYNSLGQIVKQEKLSLKSGVSKKVVNTTLLSKGLCHLIIQTDENEKQVLKLMVE